MHGAERADVAVVTRLQPMRAVGFLALRLSEFIPFVNFGTMVGIATAGSTLGNLILLPACLTLGARLQARSAGDAGRETVAAEA